MCNSFLLRDYLGTFLVETSGLVGLLLDFEQLLFSQLMIWVNFLSQRLHGLTVHLVGDLCQLDGLGLVGRLRSRVVLDECHQLRQHLEKLLLLN